MVALLSGISGGYEMWTKKGGEKKSKRRKLGRGERSKEKGKIMKKGCSRERYWRIKIKYL